MAPKKKPKAIVTDFDDCIVNFMDFLCHLHNVKYGTAISENNLTTWNFEDIEVKDARGNVVKGSELRKTFADYESEGLYAALPVIPSSRRALEIFNKLGYKVIILTARDPKFSAQTYVNLVARDIVYDEIIFDADKAKRILALKRKYNVVCFIDDKLSTVAKVAEECDLDFNFVLEKAHNRSAEIPDGVTRIRDLFEVIRVLK